MKTNILTAFLLLFAWLPAFSQPHSLTAMGRPGVTEGDVRTAMAMKILRYLGEYANVSWLKPGKAYSIEVTLPELEAGRFQGLFLENIESEYTDKIVKQNVFIKGESQ